MIKGMKFSLMISNYSTKENGIRKELTTIEAPHQNGIIKQKK
jgi:hypothetical protein